MMATATATSQQEVPRAPRRQRQESQASSDDSKGEGDHDISLDCSNEDEFDAEFQEESLHRMEGMMKKMRRSLARQKLDRAQGPQQPSRTASVVEPDGSTTGDLPARDPDVKWPQVVAFGRQLHGLPGTTGASTLASAGGPFLGREEQQDRPAVFFPFSPSTRAIVERSFTALAGKNSSFSWERPPAECHIQGDRPSLSVLSGDFDPGYHVDRQGNFSAFSAGPSPEERNCLKNQAFKSSSVLSDMEALSKRTLLTLSSLEWLLGSLHKLVSGDPSRRDPQMEASIWHYTHRVLQTTTELTASTFATALHARRKEFLLNVDPLRIPSRLHPWLALRSPFAAEQKPSFFGDSLDQCRSFAREDRDHTLLQSVVRVASRKPSGPMPRASEKRKASKHLSPAPTPKSSSKKRPKRQADDKPKERSSSSYKARSSGKRQRK